MVPSPPHTSVETRIGASADTVWHHAGDLDLLAAASDEFQGGEWVAGGNPGRVGSRFVGRQRRGDREWTTTSTITASEPGRVLEWTVGDSDSPVAVWRFDLAPEGTATTVRYSVRLGPGPSGLTAAVEAAPEREEEIVAGRLRELERNMIATLERIRRITGG